MILWLWLIFLALGITLLFLGIKTEDQILITLAFIILITPAWTLTGVNIPLIDDNPGIQYTTGELTNTTYSYDNATLTNTTNNTTNQYTTYNNRTIGFLLLLAFVAGFWLALTNIRNSHDGKEPGPKINWGFYR